MLQGQRDLFTVGQMLLSELVPLVSAQQGAIYQMVAGDDKNFTLRLLAGYAQRPDQPQRITLGEGLVGQCAVEKKRILLTDIKSDYTRIQSSLAEARPRSIVVLPVLFEGQTKAVIELASLRAFSVTHLAFLEQLTQSIGVVLNTIEATMRTENLLQQSQQLTVELQIAAKGIAADERRAGAKSPAAGRTKRRSGTQEPGSRASPARARGKSRGTGADLEIQIGISGEHVARVAHAAEFDSDSGPAARRKSGGNLSGKQVEFARNIYSSGSDLLNLITDILDLSKIESGTVTVEAEEIGFASLRDSVERNFRHVADAKEPAVPRRVRCEPAARDDDRPETPAANSEEPAVERVQVHRAWPRHDSRRHGRNRLDRRSIRC